MAETKVRFEVKMLFLYGLDVSVCTLSNLFVTIHYKYDFLYAICMTLFPMGNINWGFRLARKQFEPKTIKDCMDPRFERT